MERMYALFHKFSEKEVLTKLLLELPEETWDDWLAEYYGQWCHMKKVRKVDLDCVFIQLEPTIVDNVETFSIQMFRVDREVFDLQCKNINIKQLPQIMNLYVPDCVRKKYGDLEIVCGMVRALCEDTNMYSREKVDETLFQEIKTLLRELSRGKDYLMDKFMRSESQEELKQLKKCIASECEELANTSFYTLQLGDVLEENRFSEEVYRELDPLNPPNIKRCHKMHMKIRTRYAIMRNHGCSIGDEAIVITDEHLNEGDIPYVYIEGREGDIFDNMLTSELDLYLGKIKVRMLRKISKEEILAILCMYVLYPVRMERKNKIEFLR